MTALAHAGTPDAGPAQAPPTLRSHALLSITLAVVGALMAVAGFVLEGSTWIAPAGLMGGGIALMVIAPVARGALDALVTLSPFMFYMLSPVGGILTVGSSDVLIPAIVVGLLVTAVLAPMATDSLPPLRGAAPLLLGSAVLVIVSTTVWSMLSPDFLLKRAVVDAIKLGIGVVYFIVIFVLARRGGYDAALRAFKIWAWVATALAAGSVAGISGAVEIIPSDGYRSNGYFEDPNLYAGYLLVSFSVLLFLSTTTQSRWLPFQALLIVGGIVTTGSRAGFASLLLLIVFSVLVINSARLRAMLVGVSVAAVLAGTWLFLNRESGSSILGVDRLFYASRDVEDDPRLTLWGIAIDKWTDSPIWGIGLGQFERFSAEAYRTLKSSGTGYVTHNTFLFFLVAFGLIGLGIFLWMLGWLVLNLYRSEAISRHAKHALMSGIVVLCSQFMTLNLQNLRYVWVYFGLVLGISLVRPPKPEAAVLESEE